ncbi:MAG: hypothetical protein K0R49_1780 [Burkholderiales bacterium]|jgi:MFS family permease|nr:hypothetical protein [Burkholderiales bacterium]MCE3269526.1 hypothetical protein [Burkholderiales bacterium]
MRLFFCAIITLLEMLDMSFVNTILGKLMEVFKVSYEHLSTLYISLAVGASISLPLTKYFYRVFNLKLLYQILIIILFTNFTWAFFTSNWVIFCILRAIQGFCLTLLYALSFMDVVANSKEKDQDLNLISAISIIGIISGPALSGFITLIGWNFIFILFNLILAGIFFINQKFEFNTNHKFVEIKTLDIVEYISFALLISLGSLIIDGLIPLSSLFVVGILALGLIIKYKKLSNNFIFNKDVFNKILLNVIGIHVLSRFAIIAFIPLLTSILYKFYKYSTLKISLLLTLMGIASMLGKLLYRKNLFRTQQISEVYLIFMALLSFFAFSPFNNIYLMAIVFCLFGIFSSAIFNYVNSCIFYRQPNELSEDLSVILTLIQMLLYGACTAMAFKLFSFLEVKYSVETGLAITILLMVYTSALTLYLYKKTFSQHIDG